jgi:hypothetical protein
MGKISKEVKPLTHLHLMQSLKSELKLHYKAGINGISEGQRLLVQFYFLHPVYRSTEIL